ncbi:MAG: Tex family protein [Cellvibrionaceae bacterium]
MDRIFQRIADELTIKQQQVVAAVNLLDEGATVPFISRYRKEVTGSLDDTQLRQLEERLRYLREMEERRSTILKSIEEQGKLTPELNQAISNADTKTELEDIYLPYKPKRRTKGQIAIEAGLEPLAEMLLNDPSRSPEIEAEAFINTENNIQNIKDALDGAKYILMERFSEDATLLGQLRQFIKQNGTICAAVIEGKENEGQKFKDYFEHSEPLSSIPSHRALALFRGRNEGILSLTSGLIDQDEISTSHPCEAMIANHWNIRQEDRPADKWLAEVIRWTWRIKLLSHLETDLFGDIRDQAETDAIQVFADNLKDLLLAAPAGEKATIGLDPGLRTGVKVAVVDSTGKILDHCAIFPTAPQKRTQEAEATLVHLCQKHNVNLIAIGNGTGSRETDAFVKDVLKRHSELKVQSIIVNEAGASVYSASEFAAREFPDLDVTIRGAISIARRLQDPLAELVKIEPKSIGVGQYQHDVSQSKLARALDATVEDCVNTVGVEVNTASAPLLARVSGLNQTIANNIVAFRDANGAFNNRAQLKQVPRLGDKTYEQAIGFLRIANGDNPLDASAVHPEAYPVAKAICQRADKEITALLSNAAILRDYKPEEFTTEKFGLPTVKDILTELEKPGRDPRPEFKTATFKDGVDTMKDLKPGMILEGVITNVANFGAFVDIGVHQDGLVHISALSDTFVKDPRTIVKAGDIVKVKVLEVDVARKRIGLTMRLSDEVHSVAKSNANDRAHKKQAKRSQQTPTTGTMGNLLQAAIAKQKGS